ncbi:hypothetical protein ID866_4425 [Astraeus odoratus]|nr:hypothetical protein ID866_4425 [Astraeus odoratus]
MTSNCIVSTFSELVSLQISPDLGLLSVPDEVEDALLPLNTTKQLSWWLCSPRIFVHVIYVCQPNSGFKPFLLLSEVLLVMLRLVRLWAHPGYRISCKDRQLWRSVHSGRGLIEELAARDFIANVTRPQELQKHLESGPRTAYAGIDPTAKSLHAGHLIPLLCLLHFQLRGNNIITLVGGATGLVGDPSGRLTERELSKDAQIEFNAVQLARAINKFFERAVEYASCKVTSQLSTIPQIQVLNNVNWLKDLNLLDFLRNTGIHFRVNNMLARDSVQTRMSAQHGITFTEFTYQLLQGYDFFELYRTLGCTIQVGGSDQWGNILSGLELINKSQSTNANNAEAAREKGFALTTPLLVTSSGEKFGKSAGNAVWLDKNLTSYLDFYQFFIRTADADVAKYLRMFTLLPLEDITAIIREHERHPHCRIAQRMLAEEITLMVHGEEGLNAAKIATTVLFDTNYSSLRADAIIKSLNGDPRLVFCTENDMFNESLPNLVAMHKLLPSKTAARQLVLAGGLYLNNIPERNPHFRLTRDSLLDGRVAIIRAGRDKHLVLALQ